MGKGFKKDICVIESLCSTPDATQHGESPTLQHKITQKLKHFKNKGMSPPWRPSPTSTPSGDLRENMGQT